MPSVSMSLQEFHDAAEEKYGDFVIDLSEDGDGSDRIVFPNPLRLSDDALDWVENIGERIAKAQEDPPEIEAARKKVNTAINRLNSLSEDASKAVRTKHEERVEQERETYDQVVKEHRPSAAVQRARALKVIEDFVRALLENPAKADRFLERAIAGDMSRGMAFVNKYKELGQVGEASPSGS